MYKQVTGNMSEQDRDDLAKRAAKMAVLVKSPERVRSVVVHIVQHFRAKIEPNGSKAQVVLVDADKILTQPQEHWSLWLQL